MPSDQRSAWECLGGLLTRRRIELDPRYRNRRVFVDERAPGQYRMINTLERGQRSNYEAATIAAFEQAYELAPGAIGRFLGGGELEPAGAAPPPSRAVPGPARHRGLPPVITRDEAHYKPFLDEVMRRAAAGDLSATERGILADEEMTAQARWDLLCWWYWVQAGQPRADSGAGAQLTPLAGNGNPGTGVLPLPDDVTQDM